MAERVVLEVEMAFRSQDAGGRVSPPTPLAGYRPHIVIGDPLQQGAIVVDGVGAEEYLGVQFLSGPDGMKADERFVARLLLPYWPDVDYGSAMPEATFTMREGGRIIGQGRITGRWQEGTGSAR
jgi:hypothetical protein